MKRLCCAICIAAGLFALGPDMSAQEADNVSGMHIRTVSGAGGSAVADGAGHMLRYTLGQAVIGYVASAPRMLSQGFWTPTGQTVSATDRPSPTPGATGLIRFDATRNPFSEETDLVVMIPESETVTVTLHDQLGRTVRHLMDGTRIQGERRVRLTRGDLPSGTYTAVLRTATTRTTLRLVIAR